MAHLSAVGLLMLIIALFAGNSTASQLQPAQSDAAATTESDGLASILNYKRYLTIYDKHYSSSVELVTRKIYFYAKAFEVYVCAWAYRARRSSHYLALNHMSDWSPRELDQMVNKVLAGEENAPLEDQTSGGERESAGERNLKRMADELEAGIREKVRQVDAESSGRQRREKREAAAAQRLGPRELPVEKLTKPSEPLPEPASVRAKVERRPTSNNPNYDELALELDTMGLVDQQQDVKLWALSVVKEQPRSQLDQVNDDLIGRSQGLGDAAAGEKLADEMFSDLRDSNCFWRPRRQGKCGACYAFAGVSMAEFMFCKSTKRLYSFSEQYFIDCGPGLVENLSGCRGGNIWAMTKFVHNFGQELRVRYPYLGHESHCPYSNDSDPEATGFIRMALHDLTYVPVEIWPMVLKRSPILVNVATPRDFGAYGGGVDSGERCKERPDHAMLVVGHGREDGQEFWLVRNSHGTGWGVDGYWKLAKSAPERCIARQEGAIWATRNGVDFHYESKLNKLNRRVQLNLSARRNK